MKKHMNSIEPKKEISGYSRRHFMNLSLAGGGLLLTPKAPSFTPLAEGNKGLPEEVSPADSLILYISLLENIRIAIQKNELTKLAAIKQLVSGEFQEMIRLAKELDDKYKKRSSDINSEVRNDFYLLIDRVKDSEFIKQRFDEIRGTALPTLEKLDATIDEIRKNMLSASETINKAMNPKDALDVLTGAERRKQAATQAFLKDAKNQIDAIVTKLTGLQPGFEKIEDAPSGRLTLLLKGVIQSIDRPLQIAPSERAMFDESGSLVQNAHARSLSSNLNPASSLWQLLREYIKPGRWYQMYPAWGVVYPVLIQTGDPGVREKLLKDALRIVPGLVPEPLYRLATALAKFDL
jgi:hypothetical protein